MCLCRRPAHHVRNPLDRRDLTARQMVCGAQPTLETKFAAPRPSAMPLSPASNWRISCFERVALLLCQTCQTDSGREMPMVD